MVRLKNYVNLLSIIATLLPLASLHYLCFWRPVVVVGVSALAPCRRSCRRRLLVFVEFSSLSAATSLLMDASVGFCSSSLLSSLSLGILSLAASFCCRRRWLLVIGVIIVGSLIVDVVLLLLLAAASRRSLKILVYISLTMHVPTTDPQHQMQNGTAAL